MNDHTHDLIAVGDAALDVFLDLEEADVTCSLRTDSCELCLNYAEKIPVGKVTRVAGAGNASNCAIGSARLGLKAALVSTIGADLVGQEIMAKWHEEGIATDHVTVDVKNGTNYSTVINFRSERTILMSTQPRDYVFPADLPAAKWLYLTAQSAGSEAMHEPILAYLKRTGAKLVFQPDTYQLRLGLEALRPLCAAAEVLIMNREEARRLTGDGHGDISAELHELHDLGCHYAIITDGPKGAYSCDGEQQWHMGIFDTPVVERTGSGDAFATAVTAALHHGLRIEEALRWGTANSASVIGFIGPHDGLLDQDGLKKMMDRFPNQKAERVMPDAHAAATI